MTPELYSDHNDAGDPFALEALREGRPNSALQVYLARGGKLSEYPRTARPSVIPALDRALAVRLTRDISKEAAQ